MTLPTWTTACPDWRDRIRDGRGLISFPPLFPAVAKDALDRHFKPLKIVDANGQPTIGDAGRDWVLDFAAAIFGALDVETGRRLIREFFLLISKKNGKSTTAAGIMMSALTMNWRKSAEFLIIAPTIEIANNSFYPARDMVKADDELADILHVQEHLKTITHRNTGAYLKVVAADNDTVSGKKATGVLIDELWLFGKRANAENMLREATGGLVSRPEGFIVYLSTQSDEPPAGVFKQKLNYFRKVRDGEIVDPRSLPVLYEFPEDMVQKQEYLNLANARITNPNLGLSVDEEWMRDKLAEAQNNGDASLRGFLAKHLNVEIGLALQSDAWPGAKYWERATDKTLTLETLIERSEIITVGVDGGGLDDLFGLGVIGRERGTRRRLVWAHAWCHEDVLELRKSEAARLRDFERDGDLTIVDRMETAFVEAADIVQKIFDSGLFAGVGLDTYGVKGIVDELARREIAGDDIVVGIPQGYRLQGTIKSAEVELADGKMVHADQPLMSWCVGNAKIEIKGQSALMTKQTSGTAKIDPLLAVMDAEALMVLNPEPHRSRSIYNDVGRDLLAV